MKRLLLLVLFGACEPGACESSEQGIARREQAAWVAPCKDYATLVATTGGSPSNSTCSNRNHRIEVQTATLAGEEIGAPVTCRCVRASEGSR